MNSRTQEVYLTKDELNVLWELCEPTVTQTGLGEYSNNEGFKYWYTFLHLNNFLAVLKKDEANIEDSTFWETFLPQLWITQPEILTLMWQVSLAGVSTHFDIVHFYAALQPVTLQRESFILFLENLTYIKQTKFPPSAWKKFFTTLDSGYGDTLAELMLETVTNVENIFHPQGFPPEAVQAYLQLPCEIFGWTKLAKNATTLSKDIQKSLANIPYTAVAYSLLESVKNSYNPERDKDKNVNSLPSTVFQTIAHNATSKETMFESSMPTFEESGETRWAFCTYEMLISKIINHPQYHTCLTTETRMKLRMKMFWMELKNFFT